MLTGSLLLLLAILAFARDTLLGKALHRLLVERPADFLNKVTAGHLWGVFALLTLAWAIIYVAGSDGLRMVIMASPDVGVWFALFDVGTIIDALMVVVAVASVARFRTLRLIVAASIARLMPRARSRRTRRRTKPAPTADDEDGAAYALSMLSQIRLAPAKSSLWMAAPRASNSLGFSLP